MKIGSIVIRCYEFDRMLAFWQEASTTFPREPVDDGWVVFPDPAGRGPNMSLERFQNLRAHRQNEQSAPGPLP